MQMPARLDLLRRPVAVDGVVHDDTGRPQLRDTGVLAADVSLALGAEGLGDDQGLQRHPQLTPADLDAVRRYSSVAVAFDELLQRVLDDDPSHDDVLDAYLLLPRIVLSYHEHPNMGVPVRVRSSFEAAFTDAASAAGLWIRAIGNLVLLDQVGTALKRADFAATDTTPIERALELFSDLQAKERAAVYALRNALAHDFGLVNQRNGTSPRDADLRHCFELEVDGERVLIDFPGVPWDGDIDHVRPTRVDLVRLAELTETVRERVLACHADGRLRLARSPQETRRRYIFTHGASSEEFQAKQEADDRARWGSES